LGPHYSAVLRELIGKPIIIEARSFFSLEVSVGSRRVYPQDAVTPGELFSSGQHCALIMAPPRKKERLSPFNESAELTLISSVTSKLSERLSEALAHGGLALHYSLRWIFMCWRPYGC